MTHRFSAQGALGLLLLAQTMAAQAQPATDASGASANSRASGEVAGPVLLEMFEFIGEFTTEDGEWIDPKLLLEAGDSDLTGGTQSGAEPGRGRELGARGAEQGQSVPNENCSSPRCE